jgi:hypothetical protein
VGWVRLDDNFADHPKVIGLSDTAFRLFITGLCYSNRQLTDGHIPYQIVNAWVGDNPEKPSDELEDQNLWERTAKGFQIRSYDEYQPTREKVEGKRAEARERLAKYRETQKKRVSDAFPDDFGNEFETPTPTQPNPTQPNSLDISIDISKEVEPYESDTPIPLPRVKSAKDSVIRISSKLADARSQGINAWNLSRLVEDEWDTLHINNDIGGCIALTAWYVAELQSRKLTSAEISRIGQMTKRFGRIALLAIDEAAAKDLTDLVSYAFRIAQRMYADRKA